MLWWWYTKVGETVLEADLIFEINLTADLTANTWLEADLTFEVNLTADLTGTTGTITWTSLGDAQRPFTYTAADWGSASFSADAYVKATTGTIYLQIYDNTAAAAVGSSVSTTSTSFVALATAAQTLTDGHDYVVQFGVISGDGGEVASLFGFWNLA